MNASFISSLISYVMENFQTEIKLLAGLLLSIVIILLADEGELGDI